MEHTETGNSGISSQLTGRRHNGHDNAGRRRAAGPGWDAPGTGVEACWLCGIRVPFDQLVPDGQEACADLRWYCRDTRACTDRWTSDKAV